MFKIQMYTQMGYSEEQVLKAREFSKNKQIDLFDALQILQKQKQNKGRKPSQLPAFSFLKSIHSIRLNDYQILYSTKTGKTNPSAREEVRQPNIPVGLLNVSNCCYLNSLIQCYFLMGSLVREILQSQKIPDVESQIQSKVKAKRIKKQYDLLDVLKHTFSKLKLSSKRHLDPTLILNNLVDSVGEKIEYGDEKDLHEINMCIMQRLSEGLMFTKKYYVKVPEEGSPSKIKRQQNIKRLFYGEKVEYTQNSEEKIETDFMGLILNPQNEDLLSALDSQFNYEVEINGKYVKRQTFIKKLPEYLFLNIIRTEYENHKVLKNSNEFAFDFIIYLDRYLDQNREQASIMNPKIKQIIHEKNKIKNQLNSLELFRNKLNECRVFAQNLNGWTDRLPKDQDLEVEKFRLEKQIELIEKDLAEIQSRKQKFVLMYLFVHRGDAVSGHYWGYGRNGKKWYRFDINCTELPQDKILVDMENSGGIPYALVYAKESQIEDFEYPYYTQMPASNENLLELHPEKNYFGYIPKEIQQSIISENKQLHAFNEEQKIHNMIKSLLREYQSKYNIVKAESEKVNPTRTIKVPRYTNFSLFLESKGEKELFKYHLYEISLLSCAKMTPEQLMANDKSLKTVQKMFKRRIKGSMALRHFSISSEPKQNARYMKLREEYIFGKKCMRFLQVVHNRIKKWPNVENLDQLMHESTKLVSSELRDIYLKNILKELQAVMLIDLALKNKVINKAWLEPYQSNQILIQQINALNGSISEEVYEESEKKYVPDLKIQKQWKIEQINKKDKLEIMVKETLSSFDKALEIYKVNAKQNKVVGVQVDLI